MILSRRDMLAAPALLIAGSAAAMELPEAATFRALELQIGGRLGVFALNTRTRRRLAWRADQRFNMCSTFKTLAVGAVLERVDRGAEHLDRIVRYSRQDLLSYAPVTTAHLAWGGLPLRDLCEAAVEVSDNTAANLILAQLGGPHAVTAWLRKIGDPITRLDRTEPALNSYSSRELDTTTAAAMAATLEKVIVGDVLSNVSRQLLIDWMVNCKTGLNRIRAGTPKTWRVADKTGTGPAGASGDNAVLWPQSPTPTPIIVSAYSRDATAPNAVVEKVYAQIGRLVSEHLAA